jgi:hypothetical protein
LNAHFAAIPRARGFGNGRNARNLFEAVVTAQAGRLVLIESPTVEQLQAVCPADLQAAIQVLAESDEASL